MLALACLALPAVAIAGDDDDDAERERGGTVATATRHDDDRGHRSNSRDDDDRGERSGSRGDDDDDRDRSRESRADRGGRRARSAAHRDRSGSRDRSRARSDDDGDRGDRSGGDRREPATAHGGSSRTGWLRGIARSRGGTEVRSRPAGSRTRPASVSTSGSATTRRVETPSNAVTGGLSARVASVGLRGAADGSGPPVTADGATPEARPEKRSKSRRSLAPEVFTPLYPMLAPAAHAVEVVPLEMWIAIGALAMLSLLSLAAAGGAAAWARRTGRRARRAERQAQTDPMTGLLNRRGLEDRLGAELERARRYGRPIAVAYVDVVGLKAVNDRHGHGSGDAVLANVAAALRAGSRDGDLVARVGGDEFTVALVEQGRAGAERFAERLSAGTRVARAELGLASPWDVTVGIAAFPADGQVCTELLAAADRRLYAQRGIEIAA